MASGQEKEAATTSTTTSSSTGESPPTQTRGEGTTATTATGTSPGHESDGEFEPSAEMLVNEFDDEHTLDEEEEMAEDGDNADEIDDLQREGEMPLEELLAMYGYNQTATTSTEPTNAGGGGSSSSQGSESTPDASSIRHVATGDVSGTPIASEDMTGTSDDGGSWVQTAIIGDDEEDEDDDEDYEEYDYSDFDEASNEGRRTTDNKVGEQWQAEVPEGLCPYDDVPAYENQDTLLWDPKDLTDDVIEQYLTAVMGDHQHNQQSSSVTSNHSTSSSGDSRDRPSPLHSFPVADDEQALLLLLQCGHKVDEAIRRLRMSSKSSPSNSSIFETMTQWSGQEMEDFEEGLRLFGKDFHAIQRNKVHSRSVQEIVHFYYMWKKTERHDVFVSRHRIEKKNYALHPTTTDYMDRFMEEFEATPSPASSVTSTGSSLIVTKSTTVGLNNNNPSNKFPSVDGPPTGNVIVNGIPRNPAYVNSTVGGDHHPIVSIPDITSHHVNTHHHNHPSHHHQHISHHSYPHHLHPSFNVHSQQQQPSKPVDIDRQEDPISIEVSKSTTPTNLDIIAVEEVVGVTGETIVSLVHDE